MLIRKRIWTKKAKAAAIAGKVRKEERKQERKREFESIFQKEKEKIAQRKYREN